MKHVVARPLVLSSGPLGWLATLSLALSACGSSPSSYSVDAVVEDSAAHPSVDDVVHRVAPDASSAHPDVQLEDAGASETDTLFGDALLDPDDAVRPDAARSPADADDLETASLDARDAGREAPAVRADAGIVDGRPPRADAMVSGDASARSDAEVSDTLTENPDAGALPCKAAAEPATLVHLTPLELKTILEGSEDPYLINVKGTTISNIPGTDAVLASDVPGIEALVGGDLCADIILYCRTGNTSQTVGAQLIAKGYLQVRDLEGGITAWTAAGYPTE